ncbi:MAG: efflux RND transporter permease subunit [Acetobacteraceae bacterium]|nr:efflux RND transporter permease subunit [Acetobacteraceae bacterium]MDW8396978.1 efflux RND transporter permease subunit [Acetobacteraceae bacterium]
MVLSDVSIKRPVFATVISLLLVVLGLASFFRLPVREYPAIDPPVISVTTVYRGASAAVVDNQITEIIESAVAGIEGIRVISSTSRDERSQVTIEFNLSRNIDAAANDVRDRIARAASRLPAEAETPVVAKQDADARPILWVALASDQFSGLELTDLARRRIVDRLAVVEGVAQVIISGERRFSMRIWLDRQELAARGLTVQDVEEAIRRENLELPGGRIESTQRELTVRTDTRLSTPEQFRNLVIARNAQGQVLLGQVARIEVGPEDARGEYRINGRPGIGIGILRQSTANTLSVADGVKAEIERIRPSLPDGIDVQYGYDESIFIAQSIYEVEHALMIALILVVGVIFLFLRSFRATIIPAVAIPVSIIASFIAMAAMGFSINVLTLLGLVLAIGLVVDDAIVVLENIHRRIEEGEPPLLAAIRGSRQIAFAVIATTAVLVAVFVPLSFLGGNTGRLFTEFGLALAASVVFSGLIALTLTPMMCSKLLRPHEGESRLVRWTEPVFLAMNNALRVTLRGALKAPLLVLGGAAALSGLAVVLFNALPKEFTPVEDRGVIIVPMTGPEGASFAYMREQVQRVERIAQRYVDSGEATVVFATLGGFARPPQSNVANVFIRLAPWHQRERSQQTLAAEIFPQLVAQVPGARAFALNPPSLGARGFQPPVQFVIGGPDYNTLVQWRDLMLERLRENPRLLNVNHNYQETKPEIRVEIDRRKAAELGVSIQAVARTIETMFGARQVGTYAVAGEEYAVLLQAREADRGTPADLTNIFVRAAGGGLVPLSNFVQISERARPQSLAREDRVRAITITASLAPGYSLGEALEYMDRTAAELLPAEARISYRGQSLEFRQSGTALYVTFAMALLVVFLVLAAQFESFVHPLIILLSTPLAVTGGLLALVLTGGSLNIYSQIGMILLIGLMAKNGILIVEFANQLRDEGKSVHDAVLEATVVRLRPILMTSIATALGAWPLAVATGAGAEARQALGVVIVGGVTLSTFVTLYAIPALYLLLAPLTKPIGAIAAKLSELEASERRRGPVAAE